MCRARGSFCGGQRSLALSRAVESKTVRSLFVETVVVEGSEVRSILVEVVRPLRKVLQFLSITPWVAENEVRVVGERWPLRKVWPLLSITTWVAENEVMQPSSQS